jgi:hypothetical protein
LTRYLPFPLAAEQGEVEKAKRAKLIAKAGGASNAEIAAALAAKTATKPSKLKSARGQDDSQPKQAFTKSAQVRFSFYPCSAKQGVSRTERRLARHA